MPCAVVCIPEGHQEKCAGQLNLLKKKNPGLKWAVTDKPLDAVSKANEMAEAESGKLCSLFIVHSKFFNITKDPFAATLFKTAQKGPTATFGCGKESGCDKPGKKFHWYMGPDGEWDVAAATKNINKLLDGQFTENGFHGKPLRKAPPSSEISAMGGTGGRSLAPAMSMGNGMGMMGSMGMGGGMGGMNGNMNGGGMGMSGSLSSGNLTGNSFGASGGMNGTMGGMSGQMGGMASPGGMRGSIGAQGGMGGGGMMTAAGDSGMGSMGAMGNTGMGGGAMGGMSGGGMNMAGGAMGGMSGGGMGMPGGGMNMSGGAMGGMSGGTMGGMSGGGMGMSGGGMGLGAAAPAPPVDVVSEAESMLSKGLPVSDVVKMLASEVKRLKVIVEGK